MREKSRYEKPACSVKSAPIPEEIKCSHCSDEIEIWSDETEVRCQTCGALVQNRECTNYD